MQGVCLESGFIMRNERDKMINGEHYNAVDPRLILDRDRASRLLHRFNKCCFHEYQMKNRHLRKLLNTKGKFWIKPSFRCDYGYNIYIGENVMINYNCVFLDVCKIEIGDDTFIGPNVQIYTACHAIDPTDRKAGVEFGKEVMIGKNVWIGGGSIVCPGVHIGDNSVIGAGSVVTKDIEANTLAYGNPCKVRKHLDKEES